MWFWFAVHERIILRSFQRLIGHLYVIFGKKKLFKSFFFIFQLGYSYFYYWIMSYSYILNTSPSTDMIYKHFLPFCKSFFSLGSNPWNTKVLILIKYNLSVFFFFVLSLCVLFLVYLKNNCLKLQKFIFMLSSKSFIVLAHTFKYLVYFKLIFFKWSKFSTLFFCMQISNHPRTICWKDWFFSHHVGTLVENLLIVSKGLFLDSQF